MVLGVFHGQLRLDDLLLEGVLVAGQVEVADQLHRDRRGALQGFAGGEVPDGCPQDAGEVDRVVLVEALVLDRHGRLLELGRDLFPGDRRAQLGGLDETETGAVGGQDLGGATRGHGMPGREAGRRVDDRRDVGGDRQDPRRTACEQDTQEDQWDAEGGSSPVPAPALYCLHGHPEGRHPAASGGCDPIPPARLPIRFSHRGCRNSPGCATTLAPAAVGKPRPARAD